MVPSDEGASPSASGLRATRASLMSVPHAALLGPVALYLLLASVGAVRNAEQINPDGVCYLRLASYLARGDAALSVSGYWSPLLSWCMAPLLAGGVDSLTAARIVLAVWGAILVLACYAYLGRYAELPARWRLLAMTGVSFLAAHWATSVITPDVILAACLVAYFACASHPDLRRSRRLQFLAGLFGGLGYLAKAYALPFVLLHYPASLLVARLRPAAAAAASQEPAGRREGFRSDLSAWVVGMVGLAVLSGPWIAVLSVKYGRPTYSVVGPIALATMAPSNIPGRHVHLSGLWPPSPPHIAVGETPEVLPYPYWSPFDSLANMKHLATRVCKNLWRARGYVETFDVLGFSLALVAAAPLAYYLLRGWSGRVVHALWVAGTILLYASGYILLLVERRYLMPMLWPLACFECFAVVWAVCEASRQLRASQPIPAASRQGLIGILLAVCFAVVPAGLWAARVMPGSTRLYREAAARLQAAGAAGPLASTLRHEGVYVAYHMGLPFLGSPLGEDWQMCDEELRKFGVKTFLVWPDSPLAKSSPPEDAGWVLAAEIGRGAEPPGPLRAYVRREGAAPAPPSAP